MLRSLKIRMQSIEEHFIYPLKPIYNLKSIEFTTYWSSMELEHCYFEGLKRNNSGSRIFDKEFGNSDLL